MLTDPAPADPSAVAAVTASLTRAQGSQPARPPRLTLRFAIYSALVLVLAAGLGIWIARASVSEKAQDRVRQNALAMAERLSADDLARSALQQPVVGAQRIDLDELFRQQTASEEIIRITLFDRNGRITYSTDHLLIGSQSDVVRIQNVLDGQDEFRRTKLEDGKDVLEAYVPVRWLLADPSFKNGVLAVHRDYGPVASEIRADTLLQAGTIGLALLILYAASFPILRRVTATLESHNRELVAHAEALRASEAKYRLIVETAAEGVWLIDAAGDTVFVNEKLADLIGYSAEELAGRPLRDFVDHVSHGALEEEWLKRRHAAGGEREIVLLRRDGAPVYATASANPVDEGGIHMGALLMVTDVTDRKHMAHDFSNVITAITGYSDLLLTQLDESDPRHREAQQIKSAADSAIALTRDLLRQGRAS